MAAPAAKGNKLDFFQSSGSLCFCSKGEEPWPQPGSTLERRLAGFAAWPDDRPHQRLSCLLAVIPSRLRPKTWLSGARELPPRRLRNEQRLELQRKKFSQHRALDVSLSCSFRRAVSLLNYKNTRRLNNLRRGAMRSCQASLFDL